MKKNDLITFMLAMIFGWSVFAILEMCSHGIVKQGLLAFILSIGVAIVALVGGLYLDVQASKQDRSGEKSNRFFSPWTGWI